MSRKIEIEPSILANLTRRAVLSSSMGLGIVAAANLLGCPDPWPRKRLQPVRPVPNPVPTWAS
jgi:hypothetical protein